MEQCAAADAPRRRAPRRKEREPPRTRGPAATAAPTAALALSHGTAAMPTIKRAALLLTPHSVQAKHRADDLARRTIRAACVPMARLARVPGRRYILTILIT